MNINRLKIITVLFVLSTGFCLAQNDTMDSTRLSKVLTKDTTLLHEAHTDALRDSFYIDRIKNKYIKALELVELADLNQSSDLKRAAFQTFVQVLSMIEETNITYPYYYAAAAFQAGKIQLSVSNYSTAYNCFVTANKYDPKNVEYLSYLAYMNENFNDPSRNRQAIANYKELIKLDPKESVYHLHLYYIYMSFGKYKAAKKELDTYTHTEGESVNSIKPYLDLYDAMNKPKKGIEYLQGFIERNPAYRMEGELYLSRHLLSLDRTSESFHYLMKNLGRIPTHDLNNLLNPYLQTMLETRDTALVYAFLDTLQTLHNDKLEVFQYSHDVRQSLGDTAGILPVLQRMYQLGKEDEQVFHALTAFYVDHQMKDEFREISARGDSIFNNEYWAYMHIITANDTSNVAQSIDVATRNINRISDKHRKSQIFCLIAENYGLLKGKLPADSAERIRVLQTLEFAAYDSALVYDSDNAEALNNYAYILATSDSTTEEDLIRAERMSARAVKLDPSATHILDTYAWVLHLRGDNATARIYINKLIRIAEAEDDKMTATEYFHIYSILAPLNDPKAADYLQLLREEYKKNPEAIRNDDKTREGIEKIL